MHHRSVLKVDDRGGARPTAGLRAAGPDDLAAVLDLLVAAALPTEGVPEAFPNFVVAERAGSVVAAGGLEIVGDHALLRSVVTHPEERGSGTGQAVTSHLLSVARTRGLASIWLRTESAEKFFERFGFRPVKPSAAPPEIEATDQFQGRCGSSAIAMTRRAQPLRVLVLCTANSARSQIAEALLQHMGGDRITAASAGTHPGSGPHPGAVAALASRGILWEGKRSKSIDEVDSSPDLVITVCDAAKESCPVLPGSRMLHWGLPDPAAEVGADRQREAFAETITVLEQRIEALLLTV